MISIRDYIKNKGHISTSKCGNSLFTRFGNRISTGFECVDGLYVKIPITMIDILNVVPNRNDRYWIKKEYQLYVRDRSIKHIKFYISGPNAGYVFIYSNQLFFKENKQL